RGWTTRTTRMTRPRQGEGTGCQRLPDNGRAKDAGKAALLRPHGREGGREEGREGRRAAASLLAPPCPPAQLIVTSAPLMETMAAAVILMPSGPISMEEPPAERGIFAPPVTFTM